MTLLQRIDKMICRYFGHRWGDWSYDPAHVNPDGTFDWPMKARICRRCGLIDVRDDFPDTMNCRCWVHCTGSDRVTGKSGEVSGDGILL